MTPRRFQRVYVEITNRCNLSCSFCPGTRRTPDSMTPERFGAILDRLRPYTDHIFLHVMGEPLSHPRLKELLRIGTEKDFRMTITTNGTLLRQVGETVLESPGVEKVSISLHSFEANGGKQIAGYLENCIRFASECGKRGKKCALRLWNLDGERTEGENRLNGEILTLLKDAFPDDWIEGRRGIRLTGNVFLEYGEKFEWPDTALPEENSALFCHGLRTQLGVLVDGTVIPCCLDHEGDIALGQLPGQSLEEILSSPRAEAMYDGFSRRTAVEPLCKTCGYARRFI